MLCSRCQKNEATVFYKQLVNNKVTEYQFCASCAKKVKGHAAVPSSPIFELLSTLGSQLRPSEQRRPRECPRCGLKYPEFRESGLLGCPACYESFAEPLGDVVKHIHGALRHSGKSPPRAGAAFDDKRKAEETASLRKSLAAAVSKEDFEEAARLRDRIRRLK
ncbi:MAG: UvrB/UvrC motif-containing protein [Elusimicrobiota bacterium]